ncbi:hypothetical protein [Salmonella enterica]|uniref:hypothetical protein n=1 Tax=Salmonella enterica TaxID=28901 RepID=UPI003454266A
MKAHSFTYQLWVTGVKTAECVSSCGVYKRTAPQAGGRPVNRLGCIWQPIQKTERTGNKQA